MLVVFVLDVPFFFKKKRGPEGYRYIVCVKNIYIFIYIYIYIYAPTR